MGDIIDLGGEICCGWTPGRPGWSWRQRLVQKYWPWMQEWWKNQSCFLVEGKMFGKSFGG